MECPYCGFYHLSPQARCARCKKPLQAEEVPEEYPEEKIGRDNDHPSLQEDEALAVEDDFDEPSPPDGQEEERLSSDYSATPAEEEMEGLLESESTEPPEGEVFGHGSSSEDDGENETAPAEEQLTKRDEDTWEEEDEESQEVEEYPEPPGSGRDCVFQDSSEENTGELVNRALQEIDIDLGRTAKKDDYHDSLQSDSMPVSDEPILATLLSESDEQEVAGEQEPAGSNSGEDHTGPPPASSRENALQSEPDEKEPADTSKPDHVPLSFEEPPHTGYQADERSSGVKKPEPRKLFDENGWDTPESFNPWQDKDDEVSRIEITGDHVLGRGSDDVSVLPPDGNVSRSRKKGLQAVRRRKEVADKEGSPADGDLLVRRACSGAVDLFIWLCLGGLLYAVSRLVGGSLHASAQQWLITIVFPVAVMTVILAMVYGALFASMAGRTPGMMLFGSRIEDENGKRPGLPRSFSRTGIYIACMLPLGLGLLSMVIGGAENNLFDRITGTKVVKAFSDHA